MTRRCHAKTFPTPVEVVGVEALKDRVGEATKNRDLVLASHHLYFLRAEYTAPIGALESGGILTLVLFSVSDSAV